MRSVKFLTWALVIGALLWAGYWFVGASGVQTGFDLWLKDRQDQGWQAETTDLQTRGFPNRFDTTFTDIRLADPATGLAWQAPFFQLLALSYKPNHLIAVWPDTQHVLTPVDQFEITSTDMRASMVVEPSTDLALERSRFSATDLKITGQNDPSATAVKLLNAAIERIDGQVSKYRIGLDADGFTPPLPLKKKLDPKGRLPNSFDALQADITLGFDRPWDRFAIEQSRPQPTLVQIDRARAQWGQLELQLAGKLDVGAAGIPTGTVTIKAQNWREILKLGVASGAVPNAFASSLERGLELLSGASGNPNTLDVPLGFKNGSIRLGPIPIAKAPILRLR